MDSVTTVSGNGNPLPLGLTAAVCAVMAEVNYVEKTGKNDFHRYKYASDADLLKQVQPAMARHGLMMFPASIEKQVTEHGKSKSGTPQFRTDVQVRYELRHVSGESVGVMAHGCGIDAEDKGVYKAMTGAMKYALRQTFLVPTGDDAEADVEIGRDVRARRRLRTIERSAPPAATAQAQPAESPAPAVDVSPAAPKNGGSATSSALEKARSMALGFLDAREELMQFFSARDQRSADAIINACKRFGLKLSDPEAPSSLFGALAQEDEAQDERDPADLMMERA